MLSKEHVDKSIKDIEDILPLEKIDPRVKSFIDICETPLCIACSGGPDSIALLMLVRYYWPKKECIILHYNHRVREASTEEERKIKAFAEYLNVKIEVGHRLNTGIATEESLRKDRYVFFEKMLRLHRSRILLLGHHQDDLLETVLMRLVRGVGLEGLIAPRAIHSMANYTKVRPLLGFKKADLINVCKALGITYFSDHTNETDICVRNRIRHQILSKFDDIFKHNWRNGFARSCSILAEHRRYLQKKLAERTQGIDFSVRSFPKNLFKEWEAVEVRYFLQQWWVWHKIEWSNVELLDEIVKNIRCGASLSLNLNTGYEVKIDDTTLKLIKKSEVFKKVFTVNWTKGTLFFPNSKALHLEKHPCSSTLLSDVVQGKFDHKNAVVLDAECVKLPLIVRNWQAGDRYCPMGKAHEKKLKELFVDNKISEKNDLPVICNLTGDILWVPGLPPAIQAKIAPSTKMCIFLFYQNLKVV